MTPAPTTPAQATWTRPPWFLAPPVLCAIPVALASLATFWVPAIASLGLLIWAAIRHRSSALPVALLCPFAFVPILSFLTGAVSYLHGSATFRHHGLPGIEFYNLDPQVRCFRSSSG